jgi:hypothetical protein
MLSGSVAACVLLIDEGPFNIQSGSDAEGPVKASFHGLSLASSLIGHTFMLIVVWTGILSIKYVSLFLYKTCYHSCIKPPPDIHLH